jgi:hypothetical protein
MTPVRANHTTNRCSTPWKRRGTAAKLISGTSGDQKPILDKLPNLDKLPVWKKCTKPRILRVNHLYCVCDIALFTPTTVAVWNLETRIPNCCTPPSSVVWFARNRTEAVGSTMQSVDCAVGLGRHANRAKKAEGAAMKRRLVGAEKWPRTYT